MPLFFSCYVHIAFTCAGQYHQYDSIVYPKHIKTHDTVVYPKDFKPSKSFFGRTKKKAKSFAAFLGFGSSSQPQEEENVLSPLDMGRLCLQVYLDEYKQMLSSGSFANLKTTVEEICHIFHLLCHPTICNHNSTQPSTKHLDAKFYEVCCSLRYHVTANYNYENRILLFHLGNEGMAGICCGCLAGWSSWKYNEAFDISTLCYSLSA